MTPLDTSRYFPDARIAGFVDDVQRGDVDRVRQKLASGIDVNYEGALGFRPIHFAFVPDSPGVLNLLLAAGANPRAAIKDGTTPLHFAVRKSSTAFAQALLAAGADPNARGEYGQPVVHQALAFSNPAILSVLASAKADINVQWGGGTPLYQALMGRRWEMAAALLDLGADVSFKAPSGKRAVDLFCDLVARIPVNTANRAKVALVSKAFRARAVALPCEAQVGRFQ